MAVVTDPLADLVAAVQRAGSVVQTAAHADRVTLDVDGRVSVTLSGTDLAALAAGSTDAALLYLAGRLEISGDAAALLDLGPRVELSPGTYLVDPAALDPEAVAAAIAGVSTEHLDAVMAGPFRGLVLGEVFRRFPEFLRADKAARVKGLTVVFEVGGRTDGLVDRYVVHIAEGTCAVTEDPEGERPSDATLALSGAQFLRLVLGQTNPVRAVLGGELAVRGELLKALAFHSVMRIPGI